MADVTPLRLAPKTDGYSHRDVILDADGVWWQRSERAGWWHGFGGGAYIHADDIPGPWTVVARADEVASLKAARDIAIAMSKRNDLLLKTLQATLGYLRVVRTGRFRPGDNPEAILTDAVGDIEHTLAETDPLRGGE